MGALARPCAGADLARRSAGCLAAPEAGNGWTEGVQLMVEGERRRFWVPQNLAYKGEPGAPRGMLVFDIDLIRIEK